MSTWTVSAAAAALPEILDRVAAGEEVTITRHGRPVAVVVRPDTLRSRRAGPALDQAAALHARLAAAGAQVHPCSSISSGRADELVAEMRRDRDER